MAQTKPSTRTNAGKNTVSNTGVPVTTQAKTKVTDAPNATLGFAPFSLQYLQFTDPKTGAVTDLRVDFREAINNVFFQKNMVGPSMLTIQFTDPNRKLIKEINQGGIIGQGTTCSINENGKQYNFELMQFVKASDQLQLIFESQAIYRLSNDRGTKATKTVVSTAVTEFITQHVLRLNGMFPTSPPVSIVAADYATVWSQLTGVGNKPITKIGLFQGTTSDPVESAWTAVSRVASGVGWRLWEDENVFYFGPDEYWLGLFTKDANGNAVPPVNKLKNKNAEIKTIHEFSDTVQLIDYDWDIGKPFAQATVTCMLDDWQFSIGEVVKVENLGPGSGYWMVSGMQRDLYNPQATLTLQVPMPFESVYNPTSAPLPGFPLTTGKII